MSEVVALKPRPETVPVEGYQPTPEELVALVAFSDRVLAAKPFPRVKVVGGEVSIDHPDAGTGGSLLLDALGVITPDFGSSILSNVSQICSRAGGPTDRDINSVLATIMEIGPRDAVETLLATQMAAIHSATMRMARQLASAKTIPQQDAAERALNKLARTFAAQVDALKRHRSKGEQRVYVERVNVAEGGKAIVGNIETGGRG